MGKLNPQFVAAILLFAGVILSSCHSSIDDTFTAALSPMEATSTPKMDAGPKGLTFCTAEQIRGVNPVFVEATPSGAMKVFGCLPFASNKIEVTIAEGITEQLEAIGVSESGQLLVFTRTSPKAANGSIYAIPQEEVTGAYSNVGLSSLAVRGGSVGNKIANATYQEIQTLGFSLGVLPKEAMMYVTLSSIPLGADIYVSSEWLGTSEITGHLRRRAIDQTYFRKAGYRDCQLEQATVVSTGAKTTYMCELEPIDVPSGAAEG